CDRVVVINRGRLVADDTPDNLSHAMSSDHKLIVRIDGPQEEVLKLLQKLPNMLQVTVLGEREKGVFDYALEADAGTDVRRELFKRLAERNWALLGSRSSELTLEDIFLQLTADNATQTNGGDK
ncbi:MAG TPA: ABC transporter, partial [Ruminococcaceae bacterium]|nr:ABC transporter [Oscillospiraceae bacterium]